MPVRRYGSGAPQSGIRSMSYNAAERAVLLVSVSFTNLQGWHFPFCNFHINLYIALLINSVLFG